MISRSLTDHYLKRGLRTIDGWLQLGAARMLVEIARIQDQMGVPGNLAEIGVHEGRLFILLCLLRNETEEAVAIDVFEQQDMNRDKSGKGDRERLQANIRKYVQHGNPPVLISADSRRLSAGDIVASAKGRIRIFSIDGGHEAETVSHDLAVAAQALCEAGVIVLDDYFNEGWPGVADGTNRFFASQQFPELVPFAIGQNKLLISRRGYAERYCEYLVSAFGDVRVRQSTLFGEPVRYFDFRFKSLSMPLAKTFSKWVSKRPRAYRLLRHMRDRM